MSKEAGKSHQPLKVELWAAVTWSAWVNLRPRQEQPVYVSNRWTNSPASFLWFVKIIIFCHQVLLLALRAGLQKKPSMTAKGKRNVFENSFPFVHINLKTLISSVFIPWDFLNPVSTRVLFTLFSLCHQHWSQAAQLVYLMVAKQEGTELPSGPDRNRGQDSDQRKAGC